MSVSIKHGIGYGQQSRAAFIDMSSVQTTATSPARDPKAVVPDKALDKSLPWARWGTNNKLPLEMAEDIDTCGILSAIIDGKARFALCNGILPALVRYDEKGQQVIEKILVDPEIDEFLEGNNHFFHTYGWLKDLCGFGNGVARFMLNMSRNKIVMFQRDDITEMRYEKMNDQGIIKNIYLSASWDKVNNPKDNRIIPVPLLNPARPLLDLKQRIEDSNAVEFAMTFRYPSWNKKYYGVPMWYAALKWVRIAQGVPEMKAAMFENNVRPKYLVIIYERFWEKVFEDDGKNIQDYTEEEKRDKKQRVYDDIDTYLAGNNNAYKTVFTDGWVGPDGKTYSEIEIKPIEDTAKAGELLPDSAAANSEIAFAMLFNPAIIGANMPSGPYTNSQGGSNVRESTLIQVIIHELERQYIRSIFNVIKRFNGWDAKATIPGTKLEFIIPATIPTTLDTGSNVKPMVTGVSPNNQSDSNGAD